MISYTTHHERPERNSPRCDYLVLLPVGATAEALLLLPLAVAIARHRKGRVALLRVVVPPPERPLSDGAAEARSTRAELEALPPSSGAADVPVERLTRVARTLADGIRTTALEQRADLILLGWQIDQSSPERLFGPPFGDLLRDAPCDVAVTRLAGDEPWRRILLPVRGGPHTPLACDLAQALADCQDAQLSVLYAADPRLPDDQAARESIQSLHTMPRISHWIERAIPIEQAILAEAPDHQAIVLGIAGRRSDAEAPGGALAERILRKTTSTVILVQHRMAVAEVQAHQSWHRRQDLSETVDRWFAENTFSSAEFEDLGRLVALKEQQGLTISLGLPALNEEATIGPIIQATQGALVEAFPLLDEIVLIDSGSQDRTREIASSYGIPVYVHQEILPQYGSFAGKGEALWKSLHVLDGDLVAWVDTDIRNFHPRFVYGILGPLLRDSRLVYSKGFYRRPLQEGLTLAATGGGRVTELVARPLLNLFYPALSGVVQPLAGEYAARRTAIELMPFLTGYGVETGLLIDLLEHYGLDALAQVDLQLRVHRNQELIPLSKMAFAIMQVVIQRLEQRQRVQLLEPVNTTMKLIQQTVDEGFQLEVREIRDHERPPMASLPEYRLCRGLPLLSGESCEHSDPTLQHSDTLHVPAL